MGRAAKSPHEWRCEIKFIASEMDLPTVNACLKLHPCLFREIYRPRRVNNTYFDTDALRFFNENRSGVAERTKIRIRWYGEKTPKVNPVLEYKIKSGISGRKKRYALPCCETGIEGDTAALQRAIDWALLPQRVRSDLACVRPWVGNSYKRRYYETNDRRFRVTIDTDLTYWKSDALWCDGESVCRDGGRIVVELKFDAELRSEAGSLFNDFPLRVEKNSKYVRGVEQVYGLLDM